ncbi:MAG TPA: MFS transporter [Pirellulales bacterium]|jgi:MFS family permease|nr:MFS transporter [Pirellulales bacterium]
MADFPESNPYRSPLQSPVGDLSRPWYREVNRYQWFVLMVAALGWLFDCLDQQLFTLARRPAMIALLHGPNGTPPPNELIDGYAGYATSIFLIGWASGGLIFGVLGDRIGRAKTMLWTILLYSMFTGLSALSTGFWDFAAYRFLTGLGVGGEFAVGVSLVAETMPDRARPFALALLQALSTVGNVSAALINMGLGRLIDSAHAWRYMFVVGTLPAMMAVVVFRYLKEPERWQAAARAEGVKRKLGSYAELFGDPRWRRNAIVGLLLAFSGVVGLWGIGFFTVDLMHSVLMKQFQAEGLTGQPLSSAVTWWTGMTSMMQNIGGFFGVWAFSRGTHAIGRKPTFAIAFTLAAASTAWVFWQIDHTSQIFWMVPIMGFCQLALFGGYAIYFPELFPTRLRSTGTSFCYNVGRFVAASGPFALGMLTSHVFNGYPEPLPLRYAGVSMCAIFLVGLVVIPFAPETRGKPLPE